MSGTLNKVMLIGHLGDEVKMHYFDDKNCVGRFPLATNETYTNKTTNDLLNRTIDQHVTLAVTGLSRSGKTAFITSLVNQLVNEGHNSNLNFFNPIHQGRFIAAKRVPQKHFHIGRFNYEQAMAALGETPPSWPEPTQGISELRLAIRYQPKDSLLKYATDVTTLYLDITLNMC